MLEFRTSKGTIKAKGGLTLKMKSPLFNTDQLKGTFSNPFEHPLFEREKRVLNFPSRITAERKTTTIPGDLFKNGIHLLTGDLVLQKSNNQYASSYFKGGLSRFTKHFSNICLDEIPMGIQVFETEAALITYLNQTAQGVSSSHPFKLPYLKAVDVVDVDENGLNETWANPETINCMDSNGSYQLNDGDGKKNLLCPMFYITHILDKLFKSINYQLIDQVFKPNYPLSELVLVNLNDLYSANSILFDIGSYYLNYSNFLPHYKVSEFLKDIQNLLNCVFIFDDKDETVSLKFKSDILKQLKPALNVKHSKVQINQSKFVSGIKFEQSFDDAIMQQVSDKIISYGYFSIPPAAADHHYRISHNLILDDYYISLPQSDGSWMWMEYTDFEAIKKSREEGEEKFLSIKTNAGFLHDLMDADFCAISKTLDNAKSLKPTLLFTKIKTTILRDEKLIHLVPNFYKAANADYFLESGFEKMNRSWFDFLQKAKYIETKIILTNALIANLDWTQPILIDGAPVLIDELNVNLSGSEQIVCELQGYTL